MQGYGASAAPPHYSDATLVRLVRLVYQLTIGYFVSTDRHLAAALTIHDPMIATGIP